MELALYRRRGYRIVFRTQFLTFRCAFELCRLYSNLLCKTYVVKLIWRFLYAGITCARLRTGLSAIVIREYSSLIEILPDSLSGYTVLSAQ